MLLLLLLLNRFSRVRLGVTPQKAATRLPHPWDSPGKNTGVGCHVLLQCMKVKSESEVAQSCLTLCDPMNRSTPCLPVHHQLPEFTQTHVHRVSDAIQPSHPLLSPSPLAPIPPSIRVFSNESTLRMRWPKHWSFSFSIGHQFYTQCECQSCTAGLYN